jgi:hypothetical protein
MKIRSLKDLNCRTGDIIILRGLRLYEQIIKIFGIEHLSVFLIIKDSQGHMKLQCNKSRIDTYILYDINHYKPIEDMILYSWKNNYVESLYYLNRAEGPDIDIYNIIYDIRSCQRQKYLTSVISTIYGYLKQPFIKRISDTPNHYICSYRTIEILKAAKIVDDCQNVLDILPHDILNLKFNQKYKYIRHNLFSKNINRLFKVFNDINYILGIQIYQPIRSDLVSDIIKEGLNI